MKQPLKEVDRKRLNEHLKELEDIQEDIEAGKQAGVRGIEELHARCRYCVDNIKKIKETFFKGKP